ncbi:thioredoxin family protein [Alkalicoccobacillus porphyridii]|uniref:Thioredoxin family protein n=1 Tax=Alkalicoccobacillus porphyridii TaxID=2597270 RepID=A0A553ZZW2_9BACI|nr:thioredoxin family protein [Alkalicoccobacillus porphyridii]TSB46965.1 thioredoxin family protein [Alkalicoccobacillus porphyridii]
MIELTAGQIEHRLQEKQELFILFVYTPLCGTCKRAASMLEILEQTYDQLELGQLNINHYPQFAQKWHIQSVPCLLVFQKGLGTKRVYAFHSIPALYSLLEPYVKRDKHVLTIKGE